MEATHSERKTCRLCGGAFKEVLDLGDIHVSTFLDTNEDPSPKIPIELVECIECGVIQLRHTVSGDTMYRKYWYQSGLNKFMVEALKDVTHNALCRVSPIQDGDIIVDIGANDGTLLAQYPEYIRTGVQLVGYEPSNLANDSGTGATIINDYFSAKTYPYLWPAKIITSIAMFYDLEDPHSFVRDVRHILAKDGVWVIQLMDLVSMIKTNDFPNLCHEHLEYYKLTEIARLMKDHGLEVFDAEYNNVNGSSLRVYVQHSGARPTEQRFYDALVAEAAFFEQVGNIGDYFHAAVEDVRNKVVAHIKYLRNTGKTIAVMGASTKGNTILQYFNLGPEDIDHAAEINPDKFGKYTVGTNIPIIPESESLSRKPDYYLILPWGFLSNFIERNQEYLDNGGTFISPLPHPTLYFKKSGVIHGWEL